MSSWWGKSSSSKGSRSSWRCSPSGVKFHLPTLSGSNSSSRRRSGEKYRPYAGAQVGPEGDSNGSGNSQFVTPQVSPTQKPHVPDLQIPRVPVIFPDPGPESGPVKSPDPGPGLSRMFRKTCKLSSECCRTPSPRMKSPGPESRRHSGPELGLGPGLVTRAGGTELESNKSQQSYRLPLPPSPASPPAMFPQSPSQTENPVFGWKKGRLLGRGTFGQVYLGFNSSERGQMCAMKEVTLSSEDPKSMDCAKQLRQEIDVLSQLHHPNIVQYYGAEMVDDKLYIYLEYVSGGSINKLLQDYGPLGEPVIRIYTRQILSGLAYLHSQNTVHRDIKGANILVDPHGRVKLADFGMAKHISGQSCVLSLKGSPYWMAPEVILNSNGCNLAVDIWSLGCTVLEMANSRPPWSQYEGVAAMFKIMNSKERPPIPDHLSDEAKSFIRKCLRRNPSRRPTAAQLLEHPFVKNSSFLDQAQGSKPVSGSSDAYKPGNTSCPVSPIGRPWNPPSPQPKLSRSPLSSPKPESGSPTPQTGQNIVIPYHQPNIPTRTDSQNQLYSGTSDNSHQNSSPNPSQGPEYIPEIESSGNNYVRHQLSRNTEERVSSESTNKASQKLTMDRVKLNVNVSIDLNPYSSCTVKKAQKIC